jgi:hypothetical protein
MGQRPPLCQSLRDEDVHDQLANVINHQRDYGERLNVFEISIEKVKRHGQSLLAASKRNRSPATDPTRLA